MGEVCRARDTRLERTVAIKLFPPGLASSPDFGMRFRCAAKAISALNHPHICTLFDVGEETEEVDAPGLFPRGRCLHLRLVVKIRRLI